MSRSYPSKLLLFGEYAILVKGEGLAIPNFDFTAAWQVKTGDEVILPLADFAAFLEETDPFFLELDIELMKSDVFNNAYIQSNIPPGYGLGSSGAVVAAVYDRYAYDPMHLSKELILGELRWRLGQMENYFHNSSSGLDPLVSLMQLPIRIKKDGDSAVVKMEKISENDFRIELVDSHQPRQTADLVATFRENMMRKEFRRAIEHEYLPIVGDCIENYTCNDLIALKNNIQLLSAFQLTWFRFAIPDVLVSDWQKSLSGTRQFYKLCGAGGGGYFMKFIFP